MLPIDPFLDGTTKITELVSGFADLLTFGFAIAFTISYTSNNHVFTIIIAAAQYIAWLCCIICYIIQWCRLEDVNTIGQLLGGEKSN